MSTNRQIDVRVFSAFRDPVKAAWVRRVARAALAIADEGGDRTVSIVIADDDTLHDLNRRFRGLDEVTDVLSFGDTGEGGSGYEVPAFAGTTEPSAPTPPPDHPHPNLLPSREKGGAEPRGNDGTPAPTPPPITLILTFSPQGRRDLSLAGTTRTPAPTPPPITLILTFSPQGRRDLSTEVVFPSLPDEPASLGEVVLSYPLAIRQAGEHNVAVEDEAALLIVHGVLHLLGHDHAEPGEEAAMKALERAALDSLKPSARSRRQSDGR